QTGVILTGVGVYSYNTQENESSRIRNKVQNIVLSHDWVLQLHGFYMDLKEKDMRFDVVLSFAIRQQEGIEILEEELRTEYPDYIIRITADVDTSDI
ncbi:MAG: cation transporter, partial [Eubacteriales bacterium]|nr:cation transporter [Eubacteriales bacterium]